MTESEKQEMTTKTKTAVPEKNEARVTKTGALVTPKGRLAYPSLFHARVIKGETDQSKAKFSTTLLIPKSADITLLYDTVKAKIAEKHWPKNARFKDGFLDTADDPRLEDLAEEFPVMIRASSPRAPNIVGAAVTQVTDETEVYAGRWARLAINPWCYDHPVGGKGVSWDLHHVQLLDKDEPIGFNAGKAEDAFEPAALNDSIDDIFS